MIINADIVDWAAEYDGPLFHAVLCDPPYHLTEIVKRFGKEGSAPAQPGTDGAFQRASKGFMGRSWDGGDLAFQPETWAALANLLHPGAFLMAFAGSRGYHRMACAIEDAGLIIHPAIGWVFGSGFPKATRIDTQVDRRAGAERETIGTRRHQPKFDVAGHAAGKNTGYNSRDRESFDVTAPATELAAAWEGHRYGLQAMKPAFEFICVAQKPYEGAPVDCITRTGAGALWIDGGRIGTDDDNQRNSRGGDNGLVGSDTFKIRARSVDEQIRHDGRWPSNFLLQHSPDCNGACVPDCPVRRLGEQSGETISIPRRSEDIDTPGATYSLGRTGTTERGHNDQGTAARYFFQASYMYERLEAADPLFYCAKSSRAERENGLAPEQIQLLRELYGIEDGETFDEDTIDDGRAKSIDNPYQRGETTRRNIHPTVKPISLAIYLSRLLLPPAMYAPRRLLVPFCGVASEYIGAMFAGFEEIVGVELEADHVAIANARVAWWQTMMRQTHSSDPRAILKAYGMKDKVKPDSTARWPAGSLFESLEVE